MSKRKEEQNPNQPQNNEITICIRQQDGAPIENNQETIEQIAELVEQFCNEHKNEKPYFEKSRIKWSRGEILTAIGVGVAVVGDIFAPICVALINKFAGFMAFVKTGTRFSWLYDDDKKVCEAVLKEYAINKSTTPVDEFVLGIKGLSKPFSQGTLIYKTKNIQALCAEHGVDNTIPGSFKPNWSKQNEKAFFEVAKSLNLL